MEFIKRLHKSGRRFRTQCLFCATSELAPPSGESQSQGQGECSTQEGLSKLIFRCEKSSGFQTFFWKCLTGLQIPDACAEGVTSSSLESTGGEGEGEEFDHLPVCQGCTQQILQIRRLHEELEKTQLLLIHHFEALQNYVKQCYHDGGDSLNLFKSWSEGFSSVSPKQSANFLRDFRGIIVAQSERTHNIPLVYLEKFYGGHLSMPTDHVPELTPPEQPQRKLISPVWQYFTRTPNRKSAKCKVCAVVVKKNLGTSALHAHLKIHHPDLIINSATRQSLPLSPSRKPRKRKAPLHAQFEDEDQLDEMEGEGDKQQGESDDSQHLFPFETFEDDNFEEQLSVEEPCDDEYNEEGEVQCSSMVKVEMDKSVLEEDEVSDGSDYNMDPLYSLPSSRSRKSKSKRKPRSLMWQFFIPAPGGRSCTCKICPNSKVVRISKNSTSALLAHMKSHHSDLLLNATKRPRRRINVIQSDDEDEVVEIEGGKVREGSNINDTQHPFFVVTSENDNYEHLADSTQEHLSSPNMTTGMNIETSPEKSYDVDEDNGAEQQSSLPIKVEIERDREFQVEGNEVLEYTDGDTSHSLPSSSCTRTPRSLIWKHFIPAPDGRSCICKVCTKVVRITKNSTSGLHMHMKMHHLEISQKMSPKGRGITTSTPQSLASKKRKRVSSETDRARIEGEFTPPKCPKGSERFRSPAWRFFIPAPDRKSAKCKVCNAVVKNTQGSTSALLSHYKIRHSSLKNAPERILGEKDESSENKTENACPSNTTGEGDDLENSNSSQNADRSGTTKVVEEAGGEHASGDTTENRDESETSTYVDPILTTTADGNKRRGPRSLVWKYFSIALDGRSGRCKVCKKHKIVKMTMGKTSALIQHLTYYHRDLKWREGKQLRKSRPPLLSRKSRLVRSSTDKDNQQQQEKESLVHNQENPGSNDFPVESGCDSAAMDGDEFRKRPKPRSSIVWKYFTPVTERSARCNLCLPPEIYRTNAKGSTSPFVFHLRTRHKNQVVFQSDSERESKEGNGDGPESITAGVWKYFIVAPDRSSATCTLCKDESGVTTTIQKNSALLPHIRSAHPSIKVTNKMMNQIKLGAPSSSPPQPYLGPVQYHKILTCEICNKIFFFESTFALHKQAHANNEIQEQDNAWDMKECVVCKGCFKQKELYQHLLSHEIDGCEKLHFCYVEGCGRCFQIGENLKIHQELDHQNLLSADIPFPVKKCEVCNLCYNSSIHLNLHMKSVHDEILQTLVSLHCPTCDQGFIAIENLVVHMHTHTSEDLQTCPMCKENLEDRSTLLAHFQAVHNTAISKKCGMCGEAFEDPFWYKDHLRKVHKKLETFICSICGHVSYLEEEHSKHVIEHSEVTEIGFPCADCDQVFQSEELLLRHRVKIHGVAQVSCKLCGKEYASRRSLFSHQKAKHVQDGGYCHPCDQYFPTQRSYDYHLSQKHSEETQYFCEVCGGSYKTEKLLKRHQLSHCQDFECGVCGRKFNNQVALDRHSGMHSEALFVCDFCGYQFHSTKTLRKHTLTYHTGKNPKPLYRQQKPRTPRTRWKDLEGNYVYAKNMQPDT